ncbi:MAG TPA: MOSC domain-containing protein [Gaiellaceae bacterium]|nr:MOSC domain-containing protein [Gaiellaceae bacterium]
MPTVVRLSTTPVKSLMLHHPEEIRLETFGVAADRRFYLIRPDGRLLAGVHHGPLALVRADWDALHDRLRLTFPDGLVVEDDVLLDGPELTDFWGHRVPGRVVEGPWADALSAYAGRPVRLVKADEPAGGVDVEPLTLVSSESVAELARQAGVDALDGRRFRMLIEIEGVEPHEEDTWTGRQVRLGEAVVEIGGPVPRCATTTRDPATGKRDLDTLREIAAYRGKRAGKHVDFGVYASVVEPGRIRVGDPVEPLRPSRYLGESESALS